MFRHPKFLHIVCFCALMFITLGEAPGVAGGRDELPGDIAVQNGESEAGHFSGACSESMQLLHAEQKRVAGEVRAIRRDIIKLRQQLEKPGGAEILGGIGYIFGLFGVAAYFMAKRDGE